MTLSFLHSVDAEPDYDYAFVFCDTGGTSPVPVASYTGIQSGAANLTLRQGEQLPVEPKPIRVQFCFDSDAAWSDEDGLQPTDCGAFAVDNIVLSGGISHFADFEASNDGWDLSLPEPSLGGDWSNLVALADLPPPENLIGCAFRDSVLVFFDPASGGHPTYQNNVAVSPWIDFDRAKVEAGPGYFIDLDGYFYLPLQNYIFIATQVQWFPDTCSTTGQAQISPWKTNGFVYRFSDGPICREKRPLTVDFSNVIPSKVKELRVGVGVVNYCQFLDNCTSLGNSSPWFDNLRFATYTFTKIQDAIDRAAAGDTVWVPPGTYFQAGNVDLTFRGKNIVLKSAAGPEHTFIDGSGMHRGMIFKNGEDSTAAVVGFTFQNCTATYDSGGAVCLGPDVSVRFEDCTFANSTAKVGGGIFSYIDARPSFSRCVFVNNVATFAGGGVYVGGGRFENCAFDSNASNYYGGGVFMPYGSGSFQFVNVSIRDTKNGWGAILGGDARVENCIFERNQGGGLKFRGLGVIRGSSFIDNLGTGLTYNLYEGLGVPSPCGQWTHVSNCRVIGNSEGGIIACGGTVDSTIIQANKKYGGISADRTHINHCMILENSGGYGGGVWMEGGLVENCTISGNMAQYGGGIWGYSSSGTYRAQTFTIKNCLISGNQAQQGGGLWIDKFVHEDVEPPYLINSTIASNRALRGGGIYLGPNTPLSLERCILWENEADNSGAQVFSADVSDSLVFICCDVDSTGVDGSGYVKFEGLQVFAIPLFCRPALASNAPTSEGDYTLSFDSPCLPDRSPCDSLIGALSEGCDVVSVLPPPTPQEPPFLKTPGIHAGPNPFTQTLTIHYLSPFGTDPRLEIYSVDGRLIGKWALRPGSGVVNWDGRDPIGKPVASGIYLVRYIAGDLRVVRRVVRITG